MVARSVTATATLLVGMWLMPAEGRSAERVVTLAPHLAELVCAVGGCARLVGVAEYTRVPPEAASKPKIGSAFSVSFESVLSLRPDWVLAWDGGTPIATIARLRELGLPVDTLAVRRLDDIGGALEQVGAGLGMENEAAAAAAIYRARLAALRAQYRGRSRIRAFFQIETAPAYTVSRLSPIHEAMDLCGADNVFADLPMLSGAVSAESVIAVRPGVVVTTSDESPAALDAYWARFPGLPASRYRVVVSADTLTRQSPAVLDGIADLCAGLDRVRKQMAADGH